MQKSLDKKVGDEEIKVLGCFSPRLIDGTGNEGLSLWNEDLKEKLFGEGFQDIDYAPENLDLYSK